MSNIFLDLLFPKRCVGCKSVGSYLCTKCAKKLAPVYTLVCLACDRPAIGGITHPGCRTRYAPDGYSTAYTFATPVKELIHELKYKGVSDIANLCATMLAVIVPNNVIERKPVVIPVPLHKVKWRQRGFNQSELLAKRLAKTIQLPLNTTVLQRITQTKSQAKLSRHERKENVKNAFACASRLSGKSVLLIDDTVTTGSTIIACANALKRAGATYVWALTLSQAPSQAW